MSFDGYDLCFGGSGGSVPVVSLVPVVPFRWLRWFQWFRSGGFVPLFLVLPHALQNGKTTLLFIIWKFCPAVVIATIL